MARWSNAIRASYQNSPPSYELENNYGVELFRKGDILQAGNHFEKSIQLQPRWWFPTIIWGLSTKDKAILPRLKSCTKKYCES